MVATDVATTMQDHALARMLDELPDAVVVLDGSATLLWANRRAEQLFEVTLAEAIGTTALDFVHPDDLELALRSLETIQGKEVGTPIELRVRAGAQWRLVEIVGHPVGWFADGAILFCLRDLTARRRYEVSHNDDARFRSLYHNATSIVLLVSPDGLVQSVSGAVTRILGHDPERVERAPLAELVEAADRPALEGAFLQALDGATAAAPVTVQVSLLHHDDTTPTVFELSMVNLVDDPTVGGLVVAAHDVSARVAAEQELKGALGELRSTLSLLNATLDSTANGILVVGLDRTITSFNRQFVNLWHLPEHVLEERDGVRVVEYILEQLVDPDSFLARIDELYARPDSECMDTIVFKDGRVMERYSSPQYLAGEVVGRVWSFNDVTDQKRLEGELAHLAFHDSLTGLANRALFSDRLEQALERSIRTRRPPAVLFLDLDDFKNINDSLGHSAGDGLLQEVGRRVVGCLRSFDTAARLGGDEFAVLVEDISRSEVRGLAERIMGTLRQPFEAASQSLTPSVSIGVTFATPGDTADELLGNADLAMYTAKLQGKSRIVEFEPRMYTAILRRLELESELRRAIASEEFIVHYQPIVDLRTSAIVGFEALARWEHPTKGLLPPSHFVSFAEEMGFIDDIDRQILAMACRDVRGWQDDGIVGPDVLLSVNLSAKEVMSTAILDTIAATLRASRFSPENLVLEITESAVMQDVEAALQNLTALTAAGLRVAIDDFGTGYSSLSHLERLPIEILKIDRSFVACTRDDEAPADLALAIIQLSRTIGVTSIAEGVESAGQAARLLEMGCHLAQGYFLGMPLDATATVALLEATLAASDTAPVG